MKILGNILVKLGLILCLFAIVVHAHKAQAQDSKRQTSFLSENELINYVSMANSIRPNSANGIPFNRLDYDKIIAYHFSGSEEPYANVIDRKGKFVPVILGQKALSQSQADKILSALAKTSSYGGSNAACFIPHFALVFYKDNKKINQISICLDCNYLEAEIEIPAQTHHQKENKETKTKYVLFGFSKSGRKAIISLCKELGFL
jgi:hypothetical protein